VIGRVLTIGWSGFLQLWRTRIYLNLLVASIALVGASLAFYELSGGDGPRVLIDLGLAFIALMTATTAGVVAIVSLTREIETRQVHLFLARPISRAELVLGRFATTATLVLMTGGLLSALLAAITAIVWPAQAGAVLAAGLFSMLEALLVAALALVFGTGSSSTMSAVFVTTIFILGRLTLPLRELIDAGKLEVARPVFEAAYAVLPRLFAFDLSDWARGTDAIDGGAVAGAALYGLLYIAALLTLAIWRLSRRDLL
jgi:ABC-type transport system involved in multi-copper enzyme maturation permease subunit